MNRTTILISITVFLSAIIIGLGFSLIHRPSGLPSTPSSGLNISQIREVKRIITTKVEGTLVKYREEMLFSKSDFSKILGDRDEFRSLVVSRFEGRISGYGVDVRGIEVDFGNNSIVLTCLISGTVSKIDGRYYATFEWLIKPFNLDFIDSHFKESEEGLYWEGEINGVYTVIDARFPNTGRVYEAWGHPNGHCHAHVWWEL